MPYEIRGQEAVKMLLSDFVTEELEKYSVNKLLGTNPPVHPEKVDEMEKSLGRADRSLVSQLRSNYCPLLRDYQYRIGKITTDLCQNCYAERERERERASHALKCICDIQPELLWTDPVLALTKIQILRA